MDEFDDIFRQATASMPAEYFRLSVVGNAAAIYRERVYCYELYHQLRLRWPENCRYRLNGEIDKQNHPYFAGEDGAPKPDLLIHVPGSHDNYAAIEVKTADNLRKDVLEKDLNTLLFLTERAGYRRGIHLVFGASAEETLLRVRRVGMRLGSIEFWGHVEAGLEAEPAGDL